MPRRKKDEAPQSDDNLPPDVMSQKAQGRLRSFAERIQNLNKEAAEIAADLKEVFAEAKGEGFHPAILRKVIKILEQDKAKRAEEQALIELYLQAIGYGDLI